MSDFGQSVDDFMKRLDRVADMVHGLGKTTWTLESDDPESELERIREYFEKSLKAAWEGNPPPTVPLLKGPPAAPLNVVLDSLRSAPVNKLTVGQIGAIIYNESKGVRPGKAGAWELEKGKLATADAIMNGDLRYGRARPWTANDYVSPKEARSRELSKDIRIAEEAYYDRMLNGTDLAHCRMFYGNRFNDYQGPRYLRNKRWEETLCHRYGPFSVPQRPVYIVIFNGPKRNPNVPHRRDAHGRKRKGVGDAR